ncbi:MAG: glycosyltransferase family 2 protein [Anaerolineaceae bacterium]|nr:glycosyltransferase family 2 protein [Anaerolineaceae bacterium]MBN2676571.1 glycosyltransferase family 2 protein [Anaerolineaceae bacterium]
MKKTNSSPYVFAAVVGWNHYNDTIECFTSLIKSDYPNIQYGYIDNASTDGAPEKTKKIFPSVHVIRNKENLGFPTGADIAIQYGYKLGADFIFVINNDTTVAPDMITRLVQCDDELTGLIAPIIYYAASPKIIWSVGGRVNRFTLEVNHQWRGRMLDPASHEVLDQDFVTGCALLIPRRTVDLIGGFDRGYFYYYDDMDLSIRVKRSGLNIKVVTTASIWHKVAATSGGQDGRTERYWMAYSSVVFFKKHAKPGQIPIIIVYRLASALKTTIRLIIKGKHESLKAYWKGLYDGFHAGGSI